MDATAFRDALESWHDFYLAVGSASAALLGLLFVGVSINLSAVSAAQRPDLRTRANVAFSNLLYLLTISLIALIPWLDARSISISFGAVATVGIVRIGRRSIVLIRHRAWRNRSLATLRRLSWTFVADLVLLYVAVSLWTTGNADWLYYMVGVVFVLLIGAADTSWDLLVRESEEAEPVDEFARR
jgi:hypothetical protein